MCILNYFSQHLWSPSQAGGLLCVPSHHCSPLPSICLKQSSFFSDTSFLWSLRESKFYSFSVNPPFPLRKTLSNLLSAKHRLVQVIPEDNRRWQFREQLYYHIWIISFSCSNRQQECNTSVLPSLLLNCGQECYNCKFISLININSNHKKISSG